MITEVKVGQVWRDKDKRIEQWNGGFPRFLRVVRIDGPHAFCERVNPGYGATKSWLTVPNSRMARIALARFKPTATGYLLEG